MSDKLDRDIIDVPLNAAGDLKRHLGIQSGTLRLSYIGGPGDVVGTYGYWREGRADPRVPSVTYSSQLYDLTQQMGAALQVVTTLPPPEETTPDIRFTQINRLSWDGRIQYYRSQARYVRDVVAKVSAFDPHVVITSLDFPSSGWKHLKQGRKLVVSAHNTFWPMGKKPSGLKAALRVKLLEHRSKALDGAVCTSHECARQINTITKGRIRGRVEHPQIVARYDVEKRQKVRRLLYLGRIERAKGIFMLLDVFVALRQKFPDLDLTFAGSGSCDNELHTKVKATGIKGLRVLGRLESAGVHREIAATDLIICPTMSDFPEGLALVGLEGAAHGIPTLQSSIVPAVDLLGKACKTFRVDDAADLKQALTELITNEAAYTDLLRNLEQVRPRLYDPSLSWGSQLARVLLDLRSGR